MSWTAHIVTSCWIRRRLINCDCWPGYAHKPFQDIPRWTREWKRIPKMVLATLKVFRYDITINLNLLSCRQEENLWFVPSQSQSSDSLPLNSPSTIEEQERLRLSVINDSRNEYCTVYSTGDCLNDFEVAIFVSFKSKHIYSYASQAGGPIGSKRNWSRY